MPSVEAFGLSMEQAQQKMAEFVSKSKAIAPGAILLFQIQQGISFVYRAKGRYEELLEPVEGGLAPPPSTGIALRGQRGCNGMQNVSKVREYEKNPWS